MEGLIAKLPSSGVKYGLFLTISGPFRVSLLSGFHEDMGLRFFECEIALINSDGAAALVLVSGETALKLGLQVIAKITGYADAAQVIMLP